jgi:hypothetical protein
MTRRGHSTVPPDHVSSQPSRGIDHGIDLVRLHREQLMPLQHPAALMETSSAI